MLGEDGRLRLARGDRHAGPRPGRRRADPGPRGRADRGVRPGRPDRLGLRGRTDQAGVAFHAGPDPGAAGGTARTGARLRLRRGHRPGHHRYLDRAGPAPDRRPGLAGPAAHRGAAARARGRAPVHRHAGPHPRAAGQPGDVRLEGRVVGRRDPPSPGPAAGWRAPLAGRAARRRHGEPGVLRRAGTSCPGQFLRRARPGRSRHILADRPRPRRGVRPAARADLRHAGAHRR